IRNDFEAVLVDDEGPTTNTATATMKVLVPDTCQSTTTTTSTSTTTSTTVPDTTTSTAPPPTVSPETTIRTPTTTTTPTPPPPEVLPATETRDLPNTGSNAVPIAVSGLLLLVAGLVLLDLRRRN
ncbi:MAG: LPXTG cell wall anchor domain-containing protein, partial [Actinomycetes bacterium]